MRKLRDWSAYLVAAAVLLPQAGKAFHIDDATFLGLARLAQQHPLRPYGGGNASNPPGAAWLLGAIITVFGDSEMALHLALLPFTFAAILAMRAAARQFGVRDPWAAALLFVCSGCVLLPATTLMPDVPMVAGVVAAAALLWSDAQAPRPWKIAAASALFAVTWTLRISALPVLVLMALVQLSKKKWRAAIPLLVLGAAFVTWTLVSREPQAAGAQGVGSAQPLTTANLHGSGGAQFVWRTLSTSAALVLFSAAALAAALLKRTRPVQGALAPLLFVVEITGLLLFVPVPFTFYPQLLVALGTLLFAIGRLRWPAWDRDSIFLWLWFAGALAVPLLYNQAAAKFMALALPPILLLILRGVDAKPARVWACAAVTLAVTVAASIDDLRFANALRELTYAQVAAAKAEAPRVFVAGTPWGAQEYAPRAGAVFIWDEVKPGTPAGAAVRPGDELLDLSYPGSLGIPFDAAAVVAEGAIGDSFPIRTMSEGAGLWSSHAGMLPWVIASGPIQPWWRVKILKPIK
jgi:hypothetical protein